MFEIFLNDCGSLGSRQLFLEARRIRDNGRTRKTRDQAGQLGAKWAPAVLSRRRPQPPPCPPASREMGWPSSCPSLPAASSALPPPSSQTLGDAGKRAGLSTQPLYTVYLPPLPSPPILPPFPALLSLQLAPLVGPRSGPGGALWRMTVEGWVCLGEGAGVHTAWAWEPVQAVTHSSPGGAWEIPVPPLHLPLS